MDEKITAMVEESRQRMHELIDTYYDEFLLRLHGVEDITAGQPALSLAVDPGRFKGEKPSVLRFPDGRLVAVKTWRSLVTAILEDCGSIPECREQLMRWGYTLYGRQRPLFSRDPSALDVPIKAADGLYFEGHFDTEFLIRQLIQALKLAGYDYTGITVELRGPQVEQEEEAGQTMSI